MTHGCWQALSPLHPTNSTIHFTADMHRGASKMRPSNSKMARDDLIQAPHEHNVTDCTTTVESSKSGEERQRRADAASALLDLYSGRDVPRTAAPLYTVTAAGASALPPLDLLGTQKHPIDLSEDEETENVAPAMPVSKLPAGQDLASWDNEFLMEKHSMAELFDVDHIHPDDLGGKLFAILKRKPHTMPDDEIYQETLRCYTRRNLRYPKKGGIRKRAKLAKKFWDGEDAPKATSSTVPDVPPPYNPPQYQTHAAPQLMAPPPTYSQLVEENKKLTAELQAAKAQLAEAQEDLGKWRGSFRAF
ncbi:hypothetical protein CKM354_000211500 [Cercospora kikuchii]|uniref:Uncharacterized protein n=1 Tax=Cercospora kikuchii TaxID=84275 RepID=A0A9P3C703_9PEZI|nr:uncharacterized protein CKM354_000211500 [Cercospora kikuchii]GIZ38709.1 hypothetical protein CKM354_000211500 [Cercospora kikuchii]